MSFCRSGPYLKRAKYLTSAGYPVLPMHLRDGAVQEIAGRVFEVLSHDSHTAEMMEVLPPPKAVLAVKRAVIKAGGGHASFASIRQALKRRLPSMKCTYRASITPENERARNASELGLVW